MTLNSTIGEIHFFDAKNRKPWDHARLIVKNSCFTLGKIHTFK